MLLIIHNPLLSANWLSDIASKLSAGGVGAFFVLLFVLFYLVYQIIVQMNKNPNINIPRGLIIVVSAILATIFSSFAFILLISNKGSEDGGKQSSSLSPGYKQNAPALYASLNINTTNCEARDIKQKLTFKSNQPFYILINSKGADELPNELALLSIADDLQSATFRIGKGEPFTVKLNTPAAISGGGCSYTLTLTEILSQNEDLFFKRKYAHYKLNPIN